MGIGEWVGEWSPPCGCCKGGRNAAASWPPRYGADGSRFCGRCFIWFVVGTRKTEGGRACIALVQCGSVGPSQRAVRSIPVGICRRNGRLTLRPRPNWRSDGSVPIPSRSISKHPNGTSRGLIGRVSQARLFRACAPQSVSLWSSSTYRYKQENTGGRTFFCGAIQQLSPRCRAGGRTLNVHIRVSLGT